MTQALEDLLEALEDVDDATREEAAKALGAIADPRSLGALIGAWPSPLFATLPPAR